MSFFVLSKLAWFVLAPLDLIAIVLVLGLAAAALGRRRLGFGLLGVATAALAAIVALPVGAWALMPLEDRFSPPPLPQAVDGIVVLGGAVDPDISAARGTAALNDAAERLVVASELARRYPAARLVLVGGSASVVAGGLAEAPVMRGLMVRQGIAPDRLVVEPKSRNTYENAAFAKALVQPKPGERWLLVTSAYHMPRAVGCFRKIGWSVIPYPVDYRTTGKADLHYYERDADLLRVAEREWIGLGAYWLTGRTSALLPG